MKYNYFIILKNKKSEFKKKYNNQNLDIENTKIRILKNQNFKEYKNQF